MIYYIGLMSRNPLYGVCDITPAKDRQPTRFDDNGKNDTAVSFQLKDGDEDIEYVGIFLTREEDDKGAFTCKMDAPFMCSNNATATCPVGSLCLLPPPKPPKCSHCKGTGFEPESLGGFPTR